MSGRASIERDERRLIVNDPDPSGFRFLDQPLGVLVAVVAIPFWRTSRVFHFNANRCRLDTLLSPVLAGSHEPDNAYR
jgi:hypothetical protein